MVAWNSGRKMFSSILAKLGMIFFDLKMSLKTKYTNQEYFDLYYDVL